MTTLYPADQCAPPIHIPPTETIGERLRDRIILEMLPDVEYVENGTKTSAVRRNLIAQAKHMTKHLTKGN